MLAIGLIIGFSLGLAILLYQQVQLNRQIGFLPQLFTRRVDNSPLPLVPRLRHEVRSLAQEQDFLRQELHTYQEIIESSPVGYLQVDEENQLLYCNKQAREMLYLQEWHPGNLRLLLEIVRSYELDNLIEKTRYQQKKQVKEWIFHPTCEDANAISQIKSQALKANSIPLPEGKVGVFLEDRQPLLEMTQARDRTFSDLSHELRTPLTSIRLVVETLGQRIDPSWERLVNRLLQEVDRLINLVQSSLELNQLENQNSLKLNYQSVELRSLAFHVWEHIEPIAEKKDVRLEYSGTECLWVKADKYRIHQVFLNLFDNAIKHSSENSSIFLDIKAVFDENNFPTVQINIVDSGTGFDPEDIPYVFDRFYKSDESRSRDVSKDRETSKSSGCGLGLAIVKQIVQAHNGIIKAMNDPQTSSGWIQVQLPEVIDN